MAERGPKPDRHIDITVMQPVDGHLAKSIAMGVMKDVCTRFGLAKPLPDPAWGPAGHTFYVLLDDAEVDQKDIDAGLVGEFAPAAGHSYSLCDLDAVEDLGGLFARDGEYPIFDPTCAEAERVSKTANRLLRHAAIDERLVTSTGGWAQLDEVARRCRCSVPYLIQVARYSQKARFQLARTILRPGDNRGIPAGYSRDQVEEMVSVRLPQLIRATQFGSLPHVRDDRLYAILDERMIDAGVEAFYHRTHLGNVPGVLKEGILCGGSANKGRSHVGFSPVDPAREACVGGMVHDGFKLDSLVILRTALVKAQVRSRQLKLLLSVSGGVLHRGGLHYRLIGFVVRGIRGERQLMFDYRFGDVAPKGAHAVVIVEDPDGRWRQAILLDSVDLAQHAQWQGSRFICFACGRTLRCGFLFCPYWDCMVDFEYDDDFLKTLPELTPDEHDLLSGVRIGSLRDAVVNSSIQENPVLRALRNTQFTPEEAIKIANLARTWRGGHAAKAAQELVIRIRRHQWRWDNEAGYAVAKAREGWIRDEVRQLAKAWKPSQECPDRPPAGIMLTPDELAQIEHDKAEDRRQKQYQAFLAARERADRRDRSGAPAPDATWRDVSRGYAAFWETPSGYWCKVRNRSWTEAVRWSYEAQVGGPHQQCNYCWGPHPGNHCPSWVDPE